MAPARGRGAGRIENDVHAVGGVRYRFPDLRTLLARASPARSGDLLAGVAAASAEERVAAQMALADLPLRALLDEPVIPYERDEVTRLIVDTHDAAAFRPVAHLTVGGFREWLLSHEATSDDAGRPRPGDHAGDGGRRLQDHAAAGPRARGSEVPRGDPVPEHARPARPALGAAPAQPPHRRPARHRRAIIDGLLYGSGDAVIGINPATDSPGTVVRLLEMVDALRERYAIPTQSCVLAHVTTTIEAMRRGAPVDLVFQSVAGTEAANAAFGVSLALLDEARDAALALRPRHAGRQRDVLRDRAGQRALRRARTTASTSRPARRGPTPWPGGSTPLLVNTVVGFIGPEYLFDGKQIMRAGLEDHFCGKLMGLPMGCDVCYTNHAEADQDDMDALLTVLAAAGVTYVMGVPGADDVMLGYQSTSFHDALYVREVLGLRPAPEFERGCRRWASWTSANRLLPARGRVLQLAEEAGL